MFAAALLLQPALMLAAWRPGPLALHLSSSSSEPRVRDRAAVRIDLVGSPVSATVVGTVLAVRREESGWAFDLGPDADSLNAVRLLLAAARGEAVPFRLRPTRYLVRLPATVSSWNAARIAMTTCSISEGGCGLSWSGPLPAVGQLVRLRVEAGPRVALGQGVVRWRSLSSPLSTAGVRFTGGPIAGTWPELVAQVARSGAPRA
jgi:hypothetical protein